MQEFTVPAVVPADPDANATDLLLARVAATPEAPLFAVPDGGEGWADITGAQFLDRVRATAKGLIANGIEPGQKIGFMCKTRYEWTVVDFAAWFAGAVLVPIYETSSPSQVQWILSDSGAIALMVETADHFAKFDEVHPDLPLIEKVWQIDLGDLDKIVAAGVDISDEALEKTRSAAIGSDLATLIYTSGTTGRPKGCILTHSNFVELCRNSGVVMGEMLENGASTLLFITIAHVFARFISVLCVHAGVKVGHQHDTKQLLRSLGTFRPTFLLAVPRVFEKVYNSSEQKAETGGRGAIFRKAAATAIEHSVAVEAGIIPLGLRLRFAVYDRLVLSKIRAAMGGRVRYAVSGSAPLGHRLGHFYHSLGIKILEGYGLTETTAPATVNLVSQFKIGTVGPALPGVAVRTVEDGEIHVSGINVFAGYWNNEAATKEVMDGAWFKTGDIGSFDADGFLTITGRKKEMIITAAGKNVAPAVLEDPIRANPLIGQVIVVGDQKPFISALITLDPEMLPVWLANNGQKTSMNLAEAARNPEVLAEIQRAVDAANSTVSRAESIRKFVVLDQDLTENSGHLTPKLTIKRNVIVKEFASDIDRLYASAPTTEGQSLMH